MRALACIVVTAALGCRSPSPAARPKAPEPTAEPEVEVEPVSGEPVDFVLPLADGRAVPVAEFRGSPVVIELAAGWSGADTAILETLSKSHPNLVIVRVSLGASLEPSIAARVGAPRGTQLAMWAHDPQGALAARLQIETIPSFLVLDPRGVEVARVEGGRPETGETLEYALRRATAESTPRSDDGMSD